MNSEITRVHLYVTYSVGLPKISWIVHLLKHFRNFFFFSFLFFSFDDW